MLNKRFISIFSRSKIPNEVLFPKIHFQNSPNTIVKTLNLFISISSLRRFSTTEKSTQLSSLLDQTQLLQHLVDPISQIPRRARFKINKAIPRIGGLYEDHYIEEFKSIMFKERWFELRQSFQRSQDEGILTSEMFEVLIMGCMKRKNIQEMTYYWNQMIRSGIKPPQELFHAMIFTYGQFGDLRKAFAFKQQMELAGYKPNVNTFSPLLQAAVISNEYYALFEMVRDMDSKLIPVDDSVVYPLAVKIVQNDCSKTFPQRFSVFLQGLFSWSLLLGYYVYAGVDNKVEETFNYIKHEYHLSSLTIGLIILYYCQKGNYSQAMEHFSFAQTNNMTLGVFSYQALLKQVSIPDRYKIAKEVWKEIASKKVNIGPKSLEDFVLQALKCDDLAIAQEILNSVDYSNLVSDSVVKLYYEKSSKLSS